MIELLDFRDTVLKHCSRLSEKEKSMFVGEYFPEDPLDPGLLARWKAENQELRDEKKDLIERVGENERELMIEQDRVEHLNHQIQELKTKSNVGNARQSTILRIGELQLVTDDMAMMSNSIDMLLANAEVVIP